MNANAAVTLHWTEATWEDARYSPLPTLVATCFTLAAVLAIWLAVGGGWSSALPDFLRPPSGGTPVELPAPAPEREQDEPAPAFFYFVVASLEQETEADELIAQGHLEHGWSDGGGPVLWYVRWADTPEAESRLWAEVGTVEESWSQYGATIDVIDLR